MSLGSVLLRPQALTAAPPPARERPAGALLELLRRLRGELLNDGPGLTILAEELRRTQDELSAEIEPRMAAAESRISALIGPFLDFAAETFGGEDGDGDLEEVLEAVPAVAGVSAAVLEGLTTPRIAQVLETFFDVLETDLGLSEARFRQLLSDTAERIVVRLEADYRSGSGDGDAYNRFALGAAIREVQSLLGHDFGLPPLTKDTLLPPLIERLDSLGLDDRLRTAAAAATRASGSLELLPALAGFFPGSTFGAGSLGAAEAGQRACWYASWLHGERLTHANPTNNPYLAGVDFGDKLDAAAMEAWAQHSFWVVCLAEIVLHGSSIERSDFVVNLLNMVWQLAQGILTLVPGFEFPRWAKWLITSFLVLAGSFEGGARCNDIFWLTLIGADISETQLYTRWTWMARELLLSIMTLANHDRERFNRFLQAQSQATADEVKRIRRVHNHNQVGGWVHFLNEMGHLMVTGIIAATDKENYGIPNNARGSYGRLFGFWVVGWATGKALAYGIGYPLARVIAGEWADSRAWGEPFLKERLLGRFTFEGGGIAADIVKILLLLPISYFLDYYVYYYLLQEGKTEGGTFSGGRRRASGEVQLSTAAPAAADIPVPAGTLVRAIQGGANFDFETSEDRTLTAGSTSVTAPVRFRPTANPYIDGVVPAGAITILLTPIAGINAVTNAQATVAGEVLRYPGYPDRSASPYRLPWNRGDVRQCGQGNMGIWMTHTPFGFRSQLYAYDFSHNDNDEVLAVRDGQLWTFVDTNPNGGDALNSVTILHDVLVDGAGNPVAGQDVDDLGNPVRTFASYLHGRQNSVTASFAARGINFATPLGQPVQDTVGNVVRVQRGEVIMRADSTGLSAYNHLHVEVRPALVDGNGNITGPAPYTIPFVFADSDVEGDGGVPRALNYYGSSNERIG